MITPRRRAASAKWLLAQYRDKTDKLKAVDPFGLMGFSGEPMVYFLRDPVAGEIKIGSAPSGRLANRVRDLQAGNPRQLSVVARCVLEQLGSDARDTLSNRSLIQRAEFRLHSRFSTDRVRDDGEWFRPSAHLLAFIEELRSGIVQDTMIDV